MGRIFFSRARFTAVKGRIASIKGKLGIRSRDQIFAAKHLQLASLKYPLHLDADILPAFISENVSFTGKYMLHRSTGKFAIGSDRTSTWEMAKNSPDIISGAINMDVFDLGKRLEFRIDSVSGFGLNLQRALSRLKDILKEGGYDMKPETAYTPANGARMIKLKAFRGSQ
jgi:hypothetical protein